MASIYDFDNSYQKYRNRQRLTGGQIDPNVVGALAEADLNARYANNKSQRALDIQQQSVNNAKTANDQQMTLANRQLAAQKASSNISNLASIPGYGLALYKVGQDAGLWGQKQPAISATPTAQMPVSLYDTSFNLPEFSNWDWQSTPSFDYSVPEIPDNLVEPTSIPWEGESDFNWTKLFEGWF